MSFENTNTYERQAQNKSNRLTKIIATVALASCLVINATACASDKINASSNPNVVIKSEETLQNNEYASDLNEDIIAIKIKDGANLRKSPFVTNATSEPNIVEQFKAKDGEPLNIETPNGVLVHDSDDNGKWYLIHNIPGAENDGKGVWVNEQKVSVVRLDIDNK